MTTNKPEQTWKRERESEIEMDMDEKFHIVYDAVMMRRHFLSVNPLEQGTKVNHQNKVL